MGVSTLHHQFPALTAMSPLQHQKQLRLQRARERMLMERIDATSAAYEVGDESVSQFNREYSRFFLASHPCTMSRLFEPTVLSRMMRREYGALEPEHVKG